MDENEIIEDTKSYENRDRFFKLIIGTAVAFVATRLAENLYDSVVEKHRNKSAEIQQ